MTDASAKPRWLTIANVISLARLAATPFSLSAVLDGQWRLAGLIFAGAVASDFIDGMVARWRGYGLQPRWRARPYGRCGLRRRHPLGASPISKSKQASTSFPGILPWFIALAFLQYLVDSRALAGQALRTSRLGRANGIAYYVVAGTVIGKNALNLEWLPDEAIYWAALAILVSTLVSMFDRLRALAKLRT